VAVSLAMAAAYGWTATRGASDDLALVAFGALERGRFWDGEVWRLVAAPLLHANLWELSGDIVGVLLVGSLLERLLGQAAFFSALAASAVAAGAAGLLGADTVSSGATGVVLGLSAALLVLHASAGGPLARGLRARLGWVTAALLADALAPSLLPASLPWGEFLSPERFSIAGGFLGGGAVALAWVAPRPRWRVAVPVAAALAALTALALQPRPGPTQFARAALEGRIYDALHARNFEEANRLLDDAGQQGMTGERFTYYRAFARMQEGRLEDALALLRPLDVPPRREGEKAFRDEVRGKRAAIAHQLGYMLYTGDGRPQDPYAGLARFDEACGAGDGEACEIARQIRQGPEVP